MQNYGAHGNACVFGEKEAPPEKLNFPNGKMMRNVARADAQNAKCKIKGRKRRRMWHVCLAVFAAVCIITSFVRAASVEHATMEVVVQEGDSLWSIWEEVGHGRFDDWVIKVKKMNDKDLSVLQPYDRVTVSIVK